MQGCDFPEKVRINLKIRIAFYVLLRALQFAEQADLTHRRASCLHLSLGREDSKFSRVPRCKNIHQRQLVEQMARACIMVHMYYEIQFFICDSN